MKFTELITCLCIVPIALLCLMTPTFAGEQERTILQYSAPAPVTTLQTAPVTTETRIFGGLRNRTQSLTDNADRRLFDSERRQSRRELREFRQDELRTDHTFSKPAPAATLITEQYQTVAPVITPAPAPVVQYQVQAPTVTYDTVIEKRVVQVPQTVTETVMVPQTVNKTIMVDQEVEVQVQVPRVVQAQTILQQEECLPAIDGEDYQDFQKSESPDPGPAPTPAE